MEKHHLTPFLPSSVEEPPLDEPQEISLQGTETALAKLYRSFLTLQSEIAGERNRHNQPRKFWAAIEELLTHMSTERGLSLNYQLSTLRSLRSFSYWMSETHPETDPAKTLTCHLAEYLATEHARGLAPASIKLIIVALKVLFAFLKDRGAIKRDPAKVLRLPKLPRHLPKVLSDIGVNQLLSANLAGSPLPFRDQAVMELFCASGIRVNELANARLKYLDLCNRTLRIIGKGSKWRIVPFTQRCGDALARYMENERPHLIKPGIDNECIFLSRRGKTLTTVRLWQIVKELGNLAGLGPRVHPHLLRHSLATDLLRNGADLRVIQELLGHADISTTQLYTHVDQTALKAAHRQFHPRAQ